MCPSHWSKVPPDLKRAVWATYRAGQCDDKQPSRDWIMAADVAINAVAIQEMSRAKAEKWYKMFTTPPRVRELIRRFYPEERRR